MPNTAAAIRPNTPDWKALTGGASLQLLEDLRQHLGDIDLRVGVMATARAVNVQQLPVPRVLVYPPDQLAPRRAVMVVVLDLLDRPVDDHPELEPAAAMKDNALAAEDEG
jgi:hypothetical protein